MFISGFVSGLAAQSELLDELFGSPHPVSQKETLEERARLAIAS